MLAELEPELKAAREEEADLRARSEQAVDRQSRWEADRHAAEMRLQSLRQEREILLRERLAGLVSLQEAARRRSGEQAVEWLNRSGLAERPRLSQKLKVSRRWRSAVELVLGDFVEAISVDELAPLARADEPAPGLMLVEGGDTSAEVGTLLGEVRGAGAAAAWLATVRTAPDVSAALSMIEGLGRGESVITPQGVWIGRGWLRVAGQQGRGRAGTRGGDRRIEKGPGGYGRLCGACPGYFSTENLPGPICRPALSNSNKDLKTAGARTEVGCRTASPMRPRTYRRCGSGPPQRASAAASLERREAELRSQREAALRSCERIAADIDRYRRTDRAAAGRLREQSIEALDRARDRPEVLAQTQAPHRPEPERGPEVARTGRQHAGRCGIGTRGNSAAAGREAGTTRRVARGAKGNRDQARWPRRNRWTRPAMNSRRYSRNCRRT